MKQLSMNLDNVIAARIGELTIQVAKQAVLINTLQLELAQRNAEIARLRGPELPLDKGAPNGHAHASH